MAGRKYRWSQGNDAKLASIKKQQNKKAKKIDPIVMKFNLHGLSSQPLLNTAENRNYWNGGNFVPYAVTSQWSVIK